VACSAPLAHRELEAAVTVSVVVPTYRRSRYLDYSLASFLCQRHGDFEIVIVNDGGDEDARRVVQKYERDLDITYLWREHRGRAAARNTGVETAQGDVVVFCDDCLMADPALIRQHLAAVRAAEDVAVVGWKRRALTVWERGRLPTVESDFLSLLDRAPALAARLPHDDFPLLDPEQVATDYAESLSLIDLGDDVINYADILDRYSATLDQFRFPWMLATTGNMSVRRQQVLDSGGFSEDYTGWGMEDTDLGYRLHRDGVRFVVDQEARGFHQLHPVGDGALGQDLRVRRGQLVKNFRVFYEKYDNDPAVRLLWLAWADAVDIFQANQILLEIEAGTRQGLPEDLQYQGPPQIAPDRLV